MERSLIWNVFKYDSNLKKIVQYNVFSHLQFYELLQNLPDNKEEFDVGLRQIAKDCFSSDSEMEIVISSNPSFISGDELLRINKAASAQLLKYERPIRQLDINVECAKKTSVYEQLCFNWKIFSNYVYSMMH